MNKKMTVCMCALLAAMTVLAAGGTKNKKGAKAMAGADEVETTGRGAKVLVDQMPKTGSMTCLRGPSIPGASLIGQAYTKPRKWIVVETKYTTYGTEDSKFLDQLTFTWHVLLETKTATENKGNKEGLSPYSYFTCTTTYFNIPQGSHAAGCVLPPSYLERYGEPKAIGFTVSNQNGDVLAGGTVSEVPGIKTDDKFWEDQSIMNATGKDGKPMIERRQGLVDRSKTIWALVQPDDYEATLQ